MRWEIVEVSKSEAADFSDVAALKEAADAFCRCPALLGARFVTIGIVSLFSLCPRGYRRLCPISEDAVGTYEPIADRLDVSNIPCTKMLDDI